MLRVTASIVVLVLASAPRARAQFDDPPHSPEPSRPLTGEITLGRIVARRVGYVIVRGEDASGQRGACILAPGRPIRCLPVRPGRRFVGPLLIGLGAHVIAGGALLIALGANPIDFCGADFFGDGADMTTCTPPPPDGGAIMAGAFVGVIGLGFVSAGIARIVLRHRRLNDLDALAFDLVPSLPRNGESTGARVAVRWRF